MSEKIKVTLDGTAETMLQSFYARAKYSLKKGHKFYDAKAVELVNKIDYDFSSAEEDSTMSNGVIARTLVFDELVEDFIDRNSDCTIVNIACGLDTRFYRMDNGKLRWLQFGSSGDDRRQRSDLSGIRKGINNRDFCLGSGLGGSD